jgi:hypothetical protein
MTCQEKQQAVKGLLEHHMFSRQVDGSHDISRVLLLARPRRASAAYTELTGLLISSNFMVCLDRSDLPCWREGGSRCSIKSSQSWPAQI